MVGMPGDSGPMSDAGLPGSVHVDAMAPLDELPPLALAGTPWTGEGVRPSGPEAAAAAEAEGRMFVVDGAVAAAAAVVLAEEPGVTVEVPLRQAQERECREVG